MFRRNQKPVVINCYTSREDVLKYTPIALSKKHIPSWFKALRPQSSLKPYLEGAPLDKLKDRRSFKLCPAMVDYHLKAFTIPMWSDLILRWDDTNWEYMFADEQSELEPHRETQWENSEALSNQQHFKIISPWTISVDEDIDFLVKQPLWGFIDLENLHIMSGVTNFSKQINTHINMFARRTGKENTLSIPFNMPMLDYIPLTERPIEIKLHLITEQEHMKREHTDGNFFFNPYRKIIKHLSQS